MTYSFEEIGAFMVIRIVGRMDIVGNVSQLDREIMGRIGDGARHLVFILEDTSCIDSAGIGLFIHCLCDVREKGGTISIVAESDGVKRTLELVGLNRLITTYNSLGDFCRVEKVTIT